MSVVNVNNTIGWLLPNGTLYLAGGKHANCTVEACPIELSVYGYRPSLAESGVLIALYGIVMIIQLAMGIRYRTWWYAFTMVLGCIDEILGYAGRILYWQDPWKAPGFIMQIVLITIGPVFFAAGIYALLGQIIQYISVERSRFKPMTYISVFLPCDIVSLVLQAVGGAMSSTSNGKSKTGVDVALAGLSFQVFTLTVFCVLVGDYFIRSRSVWRNLRLPKIFLVFTFSAALATILILVRCCYRIYELSAGYTRTSKALRDQGLFIGLESVMIIVAAFLLILSHPGPVSQHHAMSRTGLKGSPPGTPDIDDVEKK